MEFEWNERKSLVFVTIFSLSFVNSLAIILLDLNVFQIVISTTICIVILLATFLMLAKRGFFDYKAKNNGGRS